MDCIEARQHISTGLRPGSRTAVQAQLGFHVAGCETCRRALAAQPPAEDPLLAALLAAAKPAGAPAGQPPARAPSGHRRTLPLLAASAILGMMALIWAVNVLMQGKAPAGAESAQANLRSQTRLVPLALGGIGTAEPAGAPPAQQGPGDPPAATPAPAATPTPAPTATPAPTPAAPLRPVNVLLLGLDRRPGETEISRADSLMIIHIDPLSPSLALLSLPRDLWVTLPGTEQWVKINAAYSHGEEAGGPAAGAQAAKATVEQVIGQPIDYTLVTTFEGMISMVDAIGGIEINVPQALVDTSFPNFDYSTMTAQFEAGPQSMDGFWALVYSRTRHPDSDFQRIRRQQLVLLAMFARLQGLADAGQPPELAALAAGLRGSFEYTDLDPAEALRLAGALDGLDLAGVRREAIDLRYGAETSTIDGAYIIMPDLAAIQRVAAELFGN